MTTSARFLLLSALFAALLLTGCAGGGETGTGATTKTELPTPVAVGTITNFGSVYVNGVKFATTGSVFTIDGRAANESELKIGMVVSVRGTLNNDGSSGAATHIEFADDAEGLVSASNIVKGVGTLTVMGRTVNVDSATVFDTSSRANYPIIDTIPVGAVVEVSGYSAPGGALTATRVELKKAEYSPGEGEIETKGIVANLNTTDKTFILGNLTVAYSSALLKEIAETGLANALYVEVKSAQGIVNNRLTASSIEAKTDHKRINGKKGESAKLEGVITAVDTTLSRVTVNGQIVSVSRDALGSLVAGQKLELEGDFDDDGILTLKKDVKKRESASLEIKANIEGTNATNKTITLLGATFQIDAATIFEDDCEECSNRIRRFSVGDLELNSRVEIKAHRTGDLWIVSKLERTDGNDDVAKVAGKVDSVNGRDAVIGGITVRLPDGLANAKSGDELELEVVRANDLITVANTGTQISDDD